MLAIHQQMFNRNTFYHTERPRYVYSDTRERVEVTSIRKAVHDLASHTKNRQLRKFTGMNETDWVLRTGMSVLEQGRCCLQTERGITTYECLQSQYW
jgi:hypothetical protein